MNNSTTIGAERERGSGGKRDQHLHEGADAVDHHRALENFNGGGRPEDDGECCRGDQSQHEVQRADRLDHVGVERHHHGLGLVRLVLRGDVQRHLAVEAGVVGGGAWAFTGDFNTGIAASAITAGARYAGKRIEGTVMTKVAELLLSDDPKMIEEAVKLATMSPKYMAALDAITKTVGVGARAAVYAPAARQLSE